jgi:outer membrane protein TolC
MRIIGYLFYKKICRNPYQFVLSVFPKRIKWNADDSNCTYLNGFMKVFSLLIITLFSARSFAQDSTFSFRNFQDLILKNHPVARQSALLSKDARAELMIARGGFDPKLEVGFDRKVFDGKEYFNFWNNQLKVPIYWAGIDLKAGFERNVGLVLGSDIKTDLDGLSYLGFSVPLGQGLLIDARRAALKNAQIFQKSADNERVKMLNKLILSAAKDYWTWYAAHQNHILATEFYSLAAARYQLVKKRAALGDLPAIDTADAVVTLLDRRVMFEQASVDVINARLVLSNYLWNDRDQPLELPTNARPQTTPHQRINEATLLELLEKARQNHPDLLKLEFKNQQIRIDEKLGKEALKPRLDIGATSLNYVHRWITQPDNNTSAFRGDYKLNVDLIFPIFLRKERGKLQQIRLKLQANDLEQQQLRREINNDISNAYNEVRAFERQITDQENAIRNQKLVLNAEEKRFAMGESQLFLVNQRESKLNELQTKLENLKAKYEKAKAILLFAAGQLEW